MDPEPQKTQEAVPARGHILLVDDEEDIRRMTCRFLTKQGYKVTAFDDGAEGVQFYREHHQDVNVIILDMIMPKMDGHAAFREMKRINPDAKILLVSGFAAEALARECMNEGALAFVSKPFMIGDLAQIISTHMGN